MYKRVLMVVATTTLLGFSGVAGAQDPATIDGCDAIYHTDKDKIACYNRVGERVGNGLDVEIQALSSKDPNVVNAFMARRSYLLSHPEECQKDLACKADLDAKTQQLMDQQQFENDLRQAVHNAAHPDDIRR